MKRSLELPGIAHPALFTSFIPFRPFCANDPTGDTQGSQPRIRIARTEPQAIFRPRRQHTIWLGNALQGQIIQHNRDVRIGPIHLDGFAPSYSRGGVHPSDQTLRGRLFITGRPVNLARTIQTGDRV